MLWLGQAMPTATQWSCPICNKKSRSPRESVRICQVQGASVHAQSDSKNRVQTPPRGCCPPTYCIHQGWEAWSLGAPCSTCSQEANRQQSRSKTKYDIQACVCHSGTCCDAIEHLPSLAHVSVVRNALCCKPSGLNAYFMPWRWKI